MADTDLLEKKENLQNEQNDSEQNQRLRKKVDFEPMLLDEDEFQRVFDSFLVVEQARKAKKGQGESGYFKYQGRAFDPVTDAEVVVDGNNRTVTRNLRSHKNITKPIDPPADHAEEPKITLSEFIEEIERRISE